MFHNMAVYVCRNYSLTNHLALLFIISNCLRYKKKLFTFYKMITNNSYNIMVCRCHYTLAGRAHHLT